MNYRSGITCFFSFDLSTVKEMHCVVCGNACNVKRDVLGPTSWAGSMTGIKKKHDYFYCPHVEETWHKQAEELYNERSTTPSDTLKKIYDADLKELLHHNRDKINRR